jgi:hypothetical protein
MMSSALPSEHRHRVLECAYQAVAREVGRRSADEVEGHSDGVNLIDENLDMLIEIVRRTTATRIEPFRVQIMWDICEKCRYLFPSQYCALRHMKLCLLYAHASVLIEAIAATLRNLNDDEYLATHPTPNEIHNQETASLAARFTVRPNAEAP